MSRAQDEHAAASYSRGIAATAAGCFKHEIVPVTAPDGLVVMTDDELDRTPIEGLSLQSPAFRKDPLNPGSVTAGNSSPLNDGAAALVISRADFAEARHLTPVAEILGYGDAEKRSEEFTTAPSLSIPVALRRAGVSIAEVDLWEINESFSVVALVNMKILGLDSERVNVYGGAVALGHPMGASGSRIICTLINALTHAGGGIGVAAICCGGGGSSAIVIKV